MDRATLSVYDQDAAAFAQEWHEQPAPVDLHGKPPLAALTDVMRPVRVRDVTSFSG